MEEVAAVAMSVQNMCSRFTTFGLRFAWKVHPNHLRWLILEPITVENESDFRILLYLGTVEPTIQELPEPHDC
jgi:hypothetical protein